MIYWGNKLPSNEDLVSLIHSSEYFCPPGQLSEPTRVSLLPELGGVFSGYPGIQIQVNEQTVLTEFKLVDATVKQNGRKQELLFTSSFASEAYETKLDLESHYVWYESQVVSTKHRLINRNSIPVQVNWLANPVFTLPERISRFQVWGGKWIKEFQKKEIDWERDIFLRENRRGRTSHESFPGIVFLGSGTDQIQGEALGFHLAWSGNHRFLVERLHPGTLQFQMGALSEPGEIILNEGDVFSTPYLYAIRSTEGVNGIRKGFQSQLRKEFISHHPESSPRQVHVNSWEAVYFDHNEEQLKKLVDAAASLGAERFVLDDGWFQGRNDDTSSLGDWKVDKSKYPNDLFPIINYVRERKMSFGLWMEPEMVSPNSDLFRQHPDWVIQSDGLKPILGRHQRVLNLTLPEVFDHLLEKISEIIEKYSLDYIKWDHNRTLTESVHSHGQTETVYRLWKTLKERFSTTELESCASGGGRMDWGIQEFADRFWLSDSNDPVERWKMQVEATIFFPPEVIGSHVGPELCHTSYRMTDIDFRSLVALPFHFGYEMSIDKLTPQDQERLKLFTEYYKNHRTFFHSCDCLSLNTPTPSIYPLYFLSQDKSRFLLWVGVLDSENTGGSRMLYLADLLPEKSYRLRLLFSEEKHRKLNLNYQSKIFSEWGMVLTSTTLMNHGFRLPVSMPLTLWVFEGEVV